MRSSERVLKQSLRSIVEFKRNQFEFVNERDMADAFFIVCYLPKREIEKLIPNKLSVFSAEEAFDQELNQYMLYALRDQEELELLHG